MPPRKKVEKVLPEFPPATSKYTVNTGYYVGMSDNPPMYGQIPIPNGKPGCLQGITFVITGTMPSIRKEELKDLIEKYGGRVTGSISGKTDVLVRGCTEVGPKKLQDAESRGIIICDQEGLFEVIQRSLGEVPKPKPVETPAFEPPKDVEVGGSALFSEKYQPKSSARLIGNSGPIQQLKKWLSEFPNVAKRVALVSGPPGVGKTTAVALICKECGYVLNELNASDARSKSVIEGLSDATTSLSFQEGEKCMGKTVVVFDEIDGLGASDKGGLPAIVSLEKSTKVPIICICSNMNDPKFVPLTKVSLSIGFIKPVAKVLTDETVKYLAWIAETEKLGIPRENIEKIVASCDGDIRACLNALQFWGSIDDVGKKDDEMKDVVQATLKVFAQTSTFDERMDAYFTDYSRVPLYVHENLPNDSWRALSEELDYVSLGDVVDNSIRETNNWSLLNVHGLLSSVIPATLNKTPVPVLRVPKALTSNGVYMKHSRYIGEIGQRIGRSCVVPRREIYDSLGPLLLWRFGSSLTRLSGVDDLCDELVTLGLTMEDVWHTKNLFSFGLDKLPAENTKAKQLFEKEYKKAHSDNQSKILPESEVRASFMYAQTKK